MECVQTWRAQVLGEDPFRRSPVVALLPCVRLDIPHNLTLFQATLCEVGTPYGGVCVWVPWEGHSCCR